MSEEQNLKVLFVGLGNSRVAWYRIALPAMYLGCDWCGLVGEPGRGMQFVTGYVKGATQFPTFEDYDVVVIQQPRGRGWFDLIKRLKSKGVVVLAEYDDYVHGIRKSRDHDFVEHFQRDDLKRMELCLRACDGLICSTEYIARRYRSYVPRLWVCENGLDMGRYRVSPPPRGEVDGVPSVTIMWSGATGHLLGVSPWIEIVERAMDRYPFVCFASIGQDFAQRLARFENRIIAVPFAALETYPSAMMLGDIALAPAGRSSWYAGKSDLRVMEASALGIPVIADQHYHKSVVEGHTGFMVEHAGQALSRLEQLIENAELRERLGRNARSYARQNFDMKHRREQWKEALLEAYDPEGQYARAA